MSRWWLVETAEEPRDHRTTRTAMWLSILQVAGIISLSDLEVVTEETLKQITLPPQPLPPKRARKKAS